MGTKQSEDGDSSSKATLLNAGRKLKSKDSFPTPWALRTVSESENETPNNILGADEPPKCHIDFLMAPDTKIKTPRRATEILNQIAEEEKEDAEIDRLGESFKLSIDKELPKAQFDGFLTAPE